MKLGFLLIGMLALLVLLSGCLSSFEPTVSFNENGSGSVFINVQAYSEIDSQLQDMLGNKKDLKINKSEDTDGHYTYEISFNFDSAKEISKNASFEAVDQTDRTVYKYNDTVSAKTITGKNESFIDFDYCIRTPGNVTKFMVDSTKDSTYDGKNIACAEIKGDSDNVGTTIQLTTEKLKEGCKYNNPACKENEDCLDNQCVRKKGCNYDNPSCTENQDCINNRCVLKQGCDYNNPACQEGFECEENQCKEKINMALAIVLVIIAGIGGAGYFIVKKSKK